uniref:Transcription initiation factor TFIID subunit 1-like n=1 Tax=Saccoglossus kowalevskii TaxID=10224 RepID=A0ABM0MQS9_SACKO|nr:PREDICTED: transcription initiation factor TFIID subunit 1-like [Saccoglossus kowalevskii]
MAKGNSVATPRETTQTFYQKQRQRVFRRTNEQNNKIGKGSTSVTDHTMIHFNNSAVMNGDAISDQNTLPSIEIESRIPRFPVTSDRQTMNDSTLQDYRKKSEVKTSRKTITLKQNNNEMKPADTRQSVFPHNSPKITKIKNNAQSGEGANNNKQSVKKTNTARSSRQREVKVSKFAITLKTNAAKKETFPEENNTETTNWGDLQEPDFSPLTLPTEIPTLEFTSKTEKVPHKKADMEPIGRPHQREQLPPKGSTSDRSKERSTSRRKKSQRSSQSSRHDRGSTSGYQEEKQSPYVHGNDTRKHAHHERRSSKNYHENRSYSEEHDTSRKSSGYHGNSKYKYPQPNERTRSSSAGHRDNYTPHHERRQSPSGRQDGHHRQSGRTSPAYWHATGDSCYRGTSGGSRDSSPSSWKAPSRSSSAQRHSSRRYQPINDGPHDGIYSRRNTGKWVESTLIDSDSRQHNRRWDENGPCLFAGQWDDIYSRPPRQINSKRENWSDSGIYYRNTRSMERIPGGPRSRTPSVTSEDFNYGALRGGDLSSSQSSLSSLSMSTGTKKRRQKKRNRSNRNRSGSRERGYNYQSDNTWDDSLSESSYCGSGRSLASIGSDTTVEDDVFANISMLTIPEFSVVSSQFGNANVVGHPLQYKWKFWYDSRENKTSRTRTDYMNYGSNLIELGVVETIEGFWRIFNFLAPTSDLDSNANYHFFKLGIMPMWEDISNKAGGKWVLTIKNEPELLHRTWLELLLALVGEQIDFSWEVSGAVVSRRRRGDRIALWTKNRQNFQANIAICKGIITAWAYAKNVPPNGMLTYLKNFNSKREKISLEYLHHVDSLKSGNSYANTAHMTLENVIEDLIKEFR